MIDTFKEIWQTLCTNKLRTMLTGLSVAWGIFMLILLLAISNGLINSSAQSMSSNDPYRITVWGGTTSKPYKGMKEGRRIDLKDEYLDPVAHDGKDGISSVDGEVTYLAQVSTGRDYLSSASCRGVYPSSFNGRYKLISGRYINEADMRAKRKSIMLHADDVHILFRDTADVVGKTVNVGGLAFKVVGIFRHEWDKDPCIPYSTAIALNGYQSKLSSIDVHIRGVNDEMQSGALEKGIIMSLSKAANFDPEDESAVYTYDRYASSVESAKALNILNITMWVIGILTLITGIVGVSNIMFVSVKERTHEIGIRRAIGAKPRSILIQIVLESAALTTAFGYIGIVMGTIATEVVKRVFAGSQYMLDPSVDIKIAIEVTAALIVAGAVAGIFPAIKSTKVKPVEALREE